MKNLEFPMKMGCFKVFLRVGKYKFKNYFLIIMEIFTD